MCCTGNRVARTWPRFAMVLVGLVVASGCDDDGPADGDADTDIDADTDADGDGATPWSVETLQGDDVGSFPSVDVAADGTVGVVYYSNRSNDYGDCDVDVGSGTSVPPDTRFPLFYSYLADGASAWQTEQITETLHLTTPQGVSFAFSPTGTPSVAIFNGEPRDVLCSANDVSFAARDGDGTWSFEVAAAESADAPVPAGATCDPGLSTTGYAVGAWPALAFDSAGSPAILYRDIHFGGMQSADYENADAELAYRTGGWTHTMVDCGDGGGVSNAAAFDTQDRFIGLYRVPTDSHIESRHGLWAVRLRSGGTWERIMLASGATGPHPSVVTGPDEAVVVAYYEPAAQHCLVAELEDPTLFADGSSWSTVEVGDDRFDEGQAPSIALSPDRLVAVASYRCARASAEPHECDRAADAVVFAWRGAGGTWTTEVVDEGTDAFCGSQVSLDFAPDGTAWIAYACSRRTSGDQFATEIKIAHRRPLP